MEWKYDIGKEYTFNFKGIIMHIMVWIFLDGWFDNNKLDYDDNYHK